MRVSGSPRKIRCSQICSWSFPPNPTTCNNPSQNLVMGFASRLLFSRPRQERSHSFDLTEHVSEAKATITSSPSVPRLAASFVDNEILLKPALAGLLSRSYFNPASRGPPHNESVLSKTSRLECVVSGQFDSRMVVEIDDRLCLRCLLCGRAI